MTKAFIFDMDGVVADTETAYMDSFNKLVASLDIHVSREEWFRRFPGTGPPYTMSTVFKEHSFQPKEGLEHWLELWKKCYEEIISKEEIKPINGFLEFNEKINQYKIKKIIATGSHKHNAYILLKSFGIDAEYDVVGNEDVKQRKPHPDLFLAAAKKLNHKPEDCIVFEDALVGIQAAKAAGMKCVALVTSFPKESIEKEKPDLLIKDYTEINIEDVLRL